MSIDRLNHLSRAREIQVRDRKPLKQCMREAAEWLDRLPRSARTARAWAMEAHRGQSYGNRPYVVHLDAVVDVLLEFGHAEEDLLTAGFLHGVIEDTDRTRGDVEREFGADVADLVDAVTDGRGKNRRERKERAYRLIPKFPRALLVKLADRIANQRSAVEGGKESLLGMYGKEWPEFERRLRGPTAAEPMFKEAGRILA